MAGESGPRIVYCGMFGTLSRLPLMALLDAGCDVRAVVVPATEAEAPPVRRMMPPADWSPRPVSFAAALARSVVDLAWERAIPVLAVGRFGRGAVAAIGAHTPDLLAVSCFPRLFPPALLALPPLGVLNLHPAGLPRGRGPDPLFWAFREPSPELSGAGGVTVHLMTEVLDAGPTVAQGWTELSDGMRESELELRAAALGGELLAGAVADLAAGRARPAPQDERLATYYPSPGADDFVLTPDRPARWAFNFVRGIGGRGGPLRLVVGGRAWSVTGARGFDPGDSLAVPFVEEGDTLLVRCAPGTVRLAVRRVD